MPFKVWLNPSGRRLYLCRSPFIKLWISISKSAAAICGLSGLTGTADDPLLLFTCGTGGTSTISTFGADEVVF
jgi:hypothetical protein